MVHPVLVILPSVVAAGAEVQTMLQLRELRRRGVDVSLMVLSGPVDETVLASAGLTADRVCRLSNPASTLGRVFLRHLWRDLLPASHFAAAHHARLVIAHLPPGHLFARLLFLVCLLRGRRLRLIQYHHSVERRLNPADTWRKRLFAALNAALARFADHAHWHVSKAVRADISGGGTRRDSVIWNACDLHAEGDAAAARALLSPISGDPWLILLPGRLKRMKGHLMFLEALAHLCRTDGIAPGDLHLVIAGEGDQRAKIEAAIDRLGLTGRVTLLGAVPHATLLGLYELADLVAVPSIDEGFGNVAIEAIARGALVLGSNAGGLAEVLEDGRNALVFRAGDATALTRRLTEIWRRRRARLIDREAARADCARRFGLAPHMERMMDLLEKADAD